MNIALYVITKKGIKIQISITGNFTNEMWSIYPYNGNIIWQ